MSNGEPNGDEELSTHRSQPSYRYAVDGDEIIDMVQLKKGIPRAFERAIDFRAAADENQRRVDRTARSSRGAGVGGYLTGLLDDHPVGLEPSLPSLKVFLYCVGRDELFAGLWSLNLADRIEFVQSLEQADVVVHRRPRPGEKQFSYQALLKQAKERGVPFASINEPSKKELRASLLPVFELYAGHMPSFDLQLQLDDHAKKKGPRRIRL